MCVQSFVNDVTSRVHSASTFAISIPFYPSAPQFLTKSPESIESRSIYPIIGRVALIDSSGPYQQSQNFIPALSALKPIVGFKALDTTT